mmetsp:Transcript_123339/g.308095  ORF Transcript_123339/g.308095 Transcript_123339/m.308095 type:complete len:308 (-) Transcript_123339:84-1007(-)
MAVASPRKATLCAGSECNSFVFLMQLRPGQLHTDFAPDMRPTTMRPPSTSRARDLIGCLSKFTSFSFVPSVENKPTRAGPRAPLAPRSSVVFPLASGQNLQSLMKTFPLTALDEYVMTVPSSGSSLASSQTRQFPASSQAATNLLSGLKSTSRISLAFVPHLRCSTGTAGGFSAFQTMTWPSVPPVAIMLPSGEYLATFCSGSLPASSVAHSHNSVMVFSSMLSDKILQPFLELANQRFVFGEYEMWTTRDLPVFRAATVFSFPVASSYRCAWTTFGTSLLLVEPPPPAERKIWPPLLARARTGKGT